VRQLSLCGQYSVSTHLAISIAAADQGFASIDGFGTIGDPGVNVNGSCCNSAGVISGEEKQSRYNAMKKSSLAAHATKRTICHAD